VPAVFTPALEAAAVHRMEQVCRSALAALQTQSVAEVLYLSLLVMAVVWVVVCPSWQAKATLSGVQSP
jgi:hypothetical protein